PRRSVRAGTALPAARARRPEPPPRLLLRARPGPRGRRRGGAPAGAGTPHGPRVRVPDRAARPRAAGSGESAGRRAVGARAGGRVRYVLALAAGDGRGARSEEHTSELQSRGHLVCRLLLEKK